MSETSSRDSVGPLTAENLAMFFFAVQGDDLQEAVDPLSWGGTFGGNTLGATMTASRGAMAGHIWLLRWLARLCYDT